MLPRERVEAALTFEAPDVVPLRINDSEAGLYEHGDKLKELLLECGHDFSDLSELWVPEPPPPEDFDEDGAYHAFQTDEWGTDWEFRIYGIWGHPVRWPINDASDVDKYQPPSPLPCSGEAFCKEAAHIAALKDKYYIVGHGGAILEKLHSLRKFEDVLMDVTLDTPEINKLADMIVDHTAASVERSLALGCDGIRFFDDFGTETSLLMSPDTWRRFFKPRWKSLIAPVKAAGKTVHFHSCGMITDILEDLREIGADVIWPQLPLFDLPELASRCRDLGLVVEMHPDRGNLMQRGAPDDIRTSVNKLVEDFGTMSGGSWLYIEIDPGFPWKNVEALVRAAIELRS